ncbi:MAG: chromosome segregation protein SMC [Candidatus Binatia bacterium]
MRIKQLELNGFKSFVHRTVLDFPIGITGVVGPNGCGKSNVVDAIRWVLGEQSPKHLRGESMEDVIFNGNEKVAPSGMAQVSLTFENDPSARPPSDLDLDISTIPAHFRELTEITVSRRYFRSGESEYFINKTPCRLKDITELFLGTGVGTKAYAIIEQGRVEQLINAKPEDRRLFIEEAAGTTLYRSRKLAAERKMERTRENLLRVNDVLREIDRQIQYLHRMAKKAEQYRALQDEIRQLDLALCGAQWRQLTAAVSELEAELARDREQERLTLAELTRLEQDRGEKVAAQAAAEEELARRRETAAVLESECNSLRQRIELLTQEVGERERRIGRLEAESASLAQQQEQIQHAMQQQDRERLEYAQLLLFDEGELTQQEAELSQARAQVVAASAAVEAAKNAVVGVVAREAECRNALAAQARRRDDARRRLEKAAAEQAEAGERLAAVESTTAARRGDVAGLRERLRAAEGEKEQRAERVRVIAEERRGWEREANEAHNTLVQLRSRLDSLQEIQRNYEGYQRGVRSVLMNAPSEGGVLGVVADVIDVPQQYERAVAAALGDRLQYVIVRQEDDGLGAVTMLRDQDSGRGSFIPLTPRKVLMNGNGAASMNGNTRRLLDCVQVDEQYQRIAETLLGEVVLVPDLIAGLALWRKNGVHVTMVTPEGDVLDATGVITGGSERPLEEEIVSRRRQAGELAAEIAVTQERVNRAQEQTQRLQREMEEQEHALKALDRDTHALTLELVAAEKDLERLDAERPRWVDRIEVARFESTTAATEEAESHAELQRLDAELAALAGERERLEAGLRACQEGTAAAAARVDEINGELTGIKVRVAERRQRQEAAVAALGRLRVQGEDLTSRTALIATEREETQRERESLQTAAGDAAARLAVQEAQRHAVEAEIALARSALDAASAAVGAHDRLLHDTREQLDGARSRCTQYEIALAEKRLRIEHLTQTMREKYGADLADQVPSEETQEEEAALARLETLREKLARIGEVNVGAIDELRELEERAQFLRTQKEDLERSLADLERTIQRLNRASRAKFAEAFAAVNEKFQSVLPRLFRGGEARLVLTDEHNLLETGVEIVVRPPGKRLDTVSLLSGGEKALVAVSLIFSLFMINPTPFCFLDEVDAPLDDANIGRFTNLVRDMSEQSQFIVITHNKRTMQAANVLYGVTMEEPGVSKIISVAMH